MKLDPERIASFKRWYEDAMSRPITYWTWKLPTEYPSAECRRNNLKVARGNALSGWDKKRRRAV